MRSADKTCAEDKNYLFSIFALLHSYLQVRQPKRQTCTGLCPIPVFLAGICDRVPTCPSCKKRTSIFLHRAVHVVAMALNFWHSDGKFFGVEELRSRPNAMYRRFYGLTKSLVRSDGLDAEFEALRSGRRRIWSFLQGFLTWSNAFSFVGQRHQSLRQVFPRFSSARQ